MPGIFDRIRNLRDEQLSSAAPADVEQDEVSPSLWQRITNRVRQLFGPGTDVVQPRGPTMLDDATKRLMIREAGFLHVLLLMQYSTNGVFRHIEPYSYRLNKKTGAMDLFFFCRLHNEIHRGYLSRISHLSMTDEQFAPRWAVEVAQ